MAHYNLGSVLLRRGQFEEATKHFQESLEIRANYAEAYHDLGLILASQGRFDEAIARYRKALEFKPHWANAHTNLAPPWPPKAGWTRPPTNIARR